MKTEDKKLLLVFMTLVIIIIAGFATTIYYVEAKNISREREKEEATGLFVKPFADKTIGAAPLNVTFSSLLINFKGTPTYLWEFGDGNTSTEKTPKHNYAKIGSYTCNLTVADTTGKIVTTSVSILAIASNLTVNNPPTVVVLVQPTYSPRSDKPYGLTFRLKWLTDPLKDIRQQVYTNYLENLIKSNSPLLKEKSDIKCEAQVSDPEGDKIVWYKWELQLPAVKKIDGTQEWPKFYFEGENMTTLTLPLVYVYRIGDYEIRVDVTDSNGNTRADVKKFNVDKSSFESRKFTLMRTWGSFWGVNFNGKSPWVQDILLKIWVIFRPLHNISDDMMQKILSPLPPTLRERLYQLYYILVWQPKEIKYHEPNWNAPNIPNNPSPGNNSIGVNLSADLNWTCSDPDGDSIKYDVYFGLTSPPPLVIQGQSGTTFVLGTLLPSTKYYWRVVAKDINPTGGSRTTDGPLWSFTTGTG